MSMDSLLANAPDNIQIPPSRRIENEFEHLYFLLRQKEQRIYTDEELLRLPDIGAEHPHFREWLVRKQSSYHLISHLKSKATQLNILEIGCGNGWLSSGLSSISGSKVVGLDVNLRELTHAARVFYKISNLQFIHEDIRSGILKDERFDIIVFAASIQYFRDVREILNLAVDHLNPKGELHIIDSPFYKEGDQVAAVKRSIAYYSALGFPEMSNHYFHHVIGTLNDFPFQIIDRQGSLWQKVFGAKNPFPWICIKKDSFSN